MNIAILGAGVAGVGSAIALRQKGFEVTIYERHGAPTTIGAGIVIWPNAAFVLEQLGVLENIAAISGRPVRMRRLSSDNEALGAIDIEAINRDMGYTSFSILRHEFQRILVARLESLGVGIQYGYTVSGLETIGARRTRVWFDNGETITPDLIIGADGRMASCVRQYVHGHNTPVYQGFINWVGVYASECPAFADIEVSDYWGVGARFGIVPVDEYRAYWAGGVACDRIATRNPVEYRSELEVVFSRWPQPVVEMIAGTPMQRINKFYLHDHDPVHVWHKHNAIMIGDAAHAPLPTSGQGACQALEDAWHLAECLQQGSDDLHAAFHRFTEKRFEKTTDIIMAGRGFASSLFNRDENFCMERNRNSRQTDFAGVAAAMSRGWSRGLPLNA